MSPTLPDEVLDRYLGHLLEGEDERCLEIAKGVASDLPGLHRLYVSLIAPSQYRVGELWEAEEVSVANRAHGHRHERVRGSGDVRSARPLGRGGAESDDGLHA